VLTSAGVPQDRATAAMFIQRLFTVGLPRSEAGNPDLDALPRIRNRACSVRMIRCSRTPARHH